MYKCSVKPSLSIFCAHNYKNLHVCACYEDILCPCTPRPAGGIERSGCPYVRLSVDQVKIFVQGRISRSINGREFIYIIGG